MDEIELYSKLSGLNPQLEEASRFVCFAVGVGFHAGRSADDYIFLFEADDVRSELTQGGFSYLSLTNIDWILGEEFRSGRYGVLRLKVGSSSELKHFVNICLSLVRLSEHGAGSSLHEVIRAWFDFLIKRHEPTFAEALGLWGELYVLSKAEDLPSVVAAWQSSDYEIVDFVDTGIPVDVKTTVRPLREHLTTFRQHDELKRRQGWLISIWVEESPMGKSIFDLQEEILAADGLGPHEKVKICSSVLRRVGNSNYTRNLRLTCSRADLAWISMLHVPSPQITEGVLDMSWTFVLRDDVVQGSALAARNGCHFSRYFLKDD